MTMDQEKIPPFEYSGGRSFTSRLLNVTGADNLVALSDMIGVPRTTISTWHRRDMTAYEVAVRICLATGASLKYVVLGEGEPFDTVAKSIDVSIPLTKEVLQDGEITTDGVIKFDGVLLNNYSLNKDTVRLVKYDTELMMVDISKNHPTSGRYLIDIDGSISINHLQRLPGKKLAMSFGDSSVEIAQEDIKVIGRVAITIDKE